MHHDDPTDWVYWQQEQEDGTCEAVLRPLDAAPFAPILFEMADTKVHMSAYPGSKAIYCRSLGLDPKHVAWCKIDSAFDPKNRPVLMTFIGQMRKSRVDQTLPKAIKFVELILDKHTGEKGLIHTNSYKIAKAMMDELSKTKHRARLIFPQNSDERETAFDLHKSSSRPTVILSPSMTEGFDFAGDLARWQVIMKVPYPNLGDKQVNAKRERDPEWYQLETVKTLVQATGRICRSEDDYGITYILDADFDMLWGRYKDFFPEWWTESVQFVKP
jgi:Rad3-related DNA helicase